MLQQLNHPNIVRLIAYDPQTRTIVFSFGGALLRDYIHKAIDLDFETVARQLLECILYIHEQGLGHGDLKLDNLLWYEDIYPRNQESKRLCLIDFNQSGALDSLWKGISLLARDTLCVGRCLLRVATGHWARPTKSEERQLLASLPPPWNTWLLPLLFLASPLRRPPDNLSLVLPSALQTLPQTQTLLSRHGIIGPSKDLYDPKQSPAANATALRACGWNLEAMRELS